MPVPTLGLDLDVLTDHVETKILQQFQIVGHRQIARRREAAVRIIALVEDALKELGFIVQAEHLMALVLDDGEFPHREIAMHHIVIHADFQAI